MKWKLAALLVGCMVGYWSVDNFDPGVLKGKRVLVTGASTGIGEQLAYTYARMGANLVITARRETRLQEVVSRCREVGSADGQYDYIVADMSHLNDTERVVKAAVEKLGGLDFLVLNHIVLNVLAHWEGGSTQNLTTLDKVMRVNFFSYVHLTTHALPHLVSSGGSAVVVSSLVGKVASPLIAAYSSSKFALEGFFSSVRQEMRLRGLDVSITLCILGLISTDNANSNLRRSGQDFIADYVPRGTADEAALAIVKGGVSRSREIYYPYGQVRPAMLLRDWLPGVLEYAGQSIMSRTWTA